MIDIKINVVHSEIFETRIDHVLDMLPTADAALDLFLCSRKELGGDNYIFALRKIPQGTADILLAGAALIGDGRIIEVDAFLQTALYDLPCMRFVDRPAVLASAGIAESHTAHADPGHGQI